jgi:hypothetical protein
MSKGRGTMLDNDMFAFGYGRASHAMSNLYRDVLKLPKVLSALLFATTMAKYFSNRHLPREHLRVERDKLSPKPPTLKLYAQTRWTGAATLLSTVLQKREAITTVFVRAKQKVVDMDFDNNFFEAAIDVSTWNAIAEWEPVLRYIAVVTDDLQSYTIPLSDIHVSFLYFETVVASSSVPAPVRSTITSFLKKHYASIYSPVHVLAFFLDPFSLGCRDASRISFMKPFAESDASKCAKSTRRLLRHAPPTAQAACMAQVTHVVMGTVLSLSSTGAHSDWGMVDTATLSFPHVWWHLHANGAPTLLRDLAAQVFSLVPTTESGERSFKQLSRVHTRIRNRLSDGRLI